MTKPFVATVVLQLGLHRTSVPGDDTAIIGPHPRGSVRLGACAPLGDITAITPSVAGASGEMISSTGDVNRFPAALLGGRLLRPAQLRKMMRTTVRTALCAGGPSRSW
ncbi:D-alanyl-D-alanine carboxypeptidase [Actinacidiphila alni]|uniref:D-alanyl-D-alanine carboxypeptidase n=2 Tax=Actinacidiphila alni TaxID=380248 RepID=A0A1I2LBB7_9ACTN|nr:D-alanyl-D-alanine carboxypeptidase [Actinacidiphila alni]